MLEAVDVPIRDPERFRALLPPEQFVEFQRSAEEARALLAGRVVWNVNSTSRGGGVVELLRPLVGYARGGGVDARWVVIRRGLGSDTGSLSERNVSSALPAQQSLPRRGGARRGR